MEVTFTRRGDIPFYHCAQPAWAGAAHGFSTRVGGVSPAPWDSLNLGAGRGDEAANVAENFRRFCAVLGCPTRLVKNRQEHTCRVRVVGEADVLPSPADRGDRSADALITDVPGICLTAFTADCIPILLYDPVRRAVGAAHGGWRGAAGGIAAETVRAMVRAYGCKPEDILAAIGPGIGPCCFETHGDVPDAVTAGLGAKAAPLITPLPGTDKFRVDLKGVNAQWLQAAGVAPEHIARCGACTACHPELFWSHRRVGNARGSMAALIALR